MAEKNCCGCGKLCEINGNYCFRCRKAKRDFGIGYGGVYNLRIQQAGKCKICGKLPVKRDLVMNLCKDSGKIKGLLCSRCNFGLGVFPTLELLQSAINYINAPLPQITWDKKIRNRKSIVLKDKNLLNIFVDVNLKTMRSKARYLAQISGIQEDAAMSRLRRYKKLYENCGLTNLETCDMIQPTIDSVSNSTDSGGVE